MKILVTGANGMLGNSVKRVFEGHELLLTDSIDLDVRNIKQVMSFLDKKLDTVLHLAAETDLIKAEFNPADAYLTNHTGTQNMVEFVRVLDIPIVYIGTAGIFDGSKSFYLEDDIPNPLHHYGRSKYYGECAVRTHEKHYIIRSGWAMGGGPSIDKKFVNKVFKQIKSGVKRLYGINDVYGSPTYTMDFSKTLKNVIEAKLEYGVYNSSGKDSASRYDVLKEFVNLLGVGVETVSVTAKEYYSLFPSQATNTRSEVLCIDKIEKTGLSAMREWRISLRDYAGGFK